MKKEKGEEGEREEGGERRKDKERNGAPFLCSSDPPSILLLRLSFYFLGLLAFKGKGG